jgi:hypothetical protein
LGPQEEKNARGIGNIAIFFNEVTHSFVWKRALDINVLGALDRINERV